ncbi:MAG: outer membrane lipoprotein carrier protein LolA [Myxococcota bacterium]
MSSRTLMLLVAAAFAWATGTAHAQAPTLERVLTAFADVPGLTANFAEEKRIALMAVPVRSEGTITYVPGRLLRTVTAPTPSVALIEADRLTMRAGEDRQVVDFASNPLVAAFVGSIRHVLAGDREALAADYDLAFSAEGSSWTLSLTPKGARLRRFLRVMELSGTAGENVRLERIRMVEQSGDETLTTFSNVRIQRFTPAQVRERFRVQ